MTMEEKLDAYISGHGMKIKFVAQKAGIPYQRLQTSLNGTRKIKADEFIAVCETLGVDPLLFRADEEQQAG